MNTHNTHHYDPGAPVSRASLLAMLQAALAANEIRFARQSALQWLSIYPGDLEVRFLHAQAVLKVRGAKEALPYLDNLSDIDPQWLDLHRLIYQYRKLEGMDNQAVSAACLIALGAQVIQQEGLPEWGVLLAKARQAQAQLKFDQAEILVQRALLADPPTPLAATYHLEMVKTAGQSTPKAIRSLAEHYRQRWPETAQIYLYLADALMEGGESDDAVALLHKVVANDISGQTAIRLWGADHRYSSLWHEKLEAILDLSIPAPVAAAMGWNQLPEGEPIEIPVEIPDDEAHPDGESGIDMSAPARSALPANDVSEEFRGASGDPEALPKGAPTLPETLRSVQAELEKVAQRLRKPHLAKADGRYPVYVVFSTRRGLEEAYGEKASDLIFDEMRLLSETITKNESWDSLVLLADDGRSTATYGIKPAQAADAWGLKLVLADLDAALRKKGEMIGALLIIGGPQVVPFHHLPNPVDDDDLDVPSDNPYATRDENYFIPEWPVGRLPGSASADPTPLLEGLRQIRMQHTPDQNPQPWYRRIFDRLLAWFWKYPGAFRQSFGYTAAAWRKASLSVFRPIGEARSMLASPPTLADHLPWNGLTPARLGYYNLHGLVDASEWFGQRDPGQAYDGPDYPIALRPKDVVNSGRSPKLVFSEACFGAHIIGKHINEAMALKFLSAGTLAMVGSTCTSYGSIATPLIAADLLGNAFWRYLQEGYPGGEALRLAKIYLAEEMHRRQGYLDGEDQKTLISFILLGDPLAEPLDKIKIRKSILRPLDPNREVKTVCDRADKSDLAPKAPQEVVDHVKQVVEQYLPGMADAALIYSQEHLECDGENHRCSQEGARIKSAPDPHPGRRVVTLSKQVRRDQLTHPLYARLTLDGQGKVVKLAVSR